jgi:hypothetical protein
MFDELSPATQHWFDSQHPLAVEINRHCESVLPRDTEAALCVLERRLPAVAQAWLDELLVDRGLILPLLERCCREGRPLPLDMRLTRLAGVPTELVAVCEELIAEADDDKGYQQALLVTYWMVRIERARSTGSAELLPSLDAY